MASFVTTVGITLHSHGNRNEIVTPEEAARFVQGWQQELTSNAQVTCLDLSCRVWRRDVLESIQAFLVENVVNTVVVLKLDDVIASLPTEEGLASIEFYTQVFKDAPCLSTVHLDDNALGSRGIEILQPLLQKETIRHLTFNNCGLSKEVAETFCDVLLKAAPHIQILSLGRNQMGAGGAQHISSLLRHMTSLQEFSYDGCRPLMEGTAYICEALVQLTETSCTLRKLNLTDCDLKDGSKDDHPVYPLAKALEKCSQLQHLMLRDCLLKADGLEIVLSAVEDSGACLESLELSGNELESEGAAKLAEFLTKPNLLNTIQKLILDTNELEDTGLEQLVDFFTQAKELRFLDLSCNQLEEAAGDLLVQNKIQSLEELVLLDNDELSEDQVAALRRMYKVVRTDEDDQAAGDANDQKEEEEDDVDELTNQLAKGANIN